MMRTSAEVWEAPAKRSLALSLLSSDERSIAGTGAAALLPLLLRASQQQKTSQHQKEVGVHQSGRKPSDWAVGGAELCLLCTSEFVGLCSAEAAHPSRRENK